MQEHMFINSLVDFKHKGLESLFLYRIAGKFGREKVWQIW